jgi:heme-degrading monooxygenase HmoA
MPYLYIWEYETEPEAKNEFIRYYKNDGEWVQLFKRSKGYFGTEPLQDMESENRFVTIDSWDSKNSRDEFIRVFAVEYDLLDKKCGEFTVKENMIGAFESI